MEFDEIHRERFTFCKTHSVQFSLWPQHCSLPAGWQVACEPQSPEACQQWLDANWTTLTPANFTLCAGGSLDSAFTVGRPLSPASGWQKNCHLTLGMGVAHYVELTGELDSPLLAKFAGLDQADTLRMRFTEETAKSGSGLMMR